jgi:hypothetical protein
VLFSEEESGDEEGDLTYDCRLPCLMNFHARAKLIREERKKAKEDEDIT